ncbi:hypothetical protein B0A69_04155 [Chryseobacterium shigense]|nr:hypothetical protein B0A69_04155 [Chryseobacterium shigense]
MIHYNKKEVPAAKPLELPKKKRSFLTAPIDVRFPITFPFFEGVDFCLQKDGVVKNRHSQ